MRASPSRKNAAAVSHSIDASAARQWTSPGHCTQKPNKAAPAERTSKAAEPAIVRWSQDGRGSVGRKAIYVLGLNP